MPQKSILTIVKKTSSEKEWIQVYEDSNIK